MMSGAPSTGAANASAANAPNATKRITIETDPRQKTIFENPNVVKTLRILLTLFYGQFFANAIYDNLIRGIPYVVGTSSAFGILRVTLGVIIIAMVVFSMFAIWKKLILASAVLLGVVSLISLVINIIDLVQRRERKEISGPEVTSEIAEIIVEFIFRIAAVLLQCVMVKFLKVAYRPVATSA